MKLMTEREQVRAVAAAWRAQFGRWTDPEKVRITRQLDALDVETATSADVAAIIGNESWVNPRSCDDCDARSWDIVRVGEEPDYESATAYLCRDCLQRALSLLPHIPKIGN